MKQTVDILVYKISAAVQLKGEITECGANMVVPQSLLDSMPVGQQESIKGDAEQTALQMMLKIIQDRGGVLLYYLDANWYPDQLTVEDGEDTDHGNVTS